MGHPCRKVVEMTPPPTVCIDFDELVVRIAETYLGEHRPAGVSGHMALKAVERMDPEVADKWRRTAMAALRYISECMGAELSVRNIEATRGIQ